MELETIDWAIILAFFAVALTVGVVVTRRAGRSSSEFFLSGRHMPWWLLGVSMVATTFSTDTPNLVTDLVRQNGVAGNWYWWAFLLTGMLTVFVYAKLWRRTGVMTDVEFYEIRYSGKAAAFLRGFRALYLGVFFNIVIMASVSLAAIKIGSVMLGFSPVQTILVAATVTVIFSTLGGFRGVLLTDFLLFFIAMVGAVAAAVVTLGHPAVGGLDGMLNHPSLQGKLALIPSFAPDSKESGELLMFAFIIPLAVQWWAAWYPGAEPGGGGYIAQRMLAAKDEKGAIVATLFFNAAYYALRPWPWIIVALCSMIVYPQLADLRQAFPHVDPDVVKHDLAYAAMLTFLPHGLLGLVLASLIAAYMSTISTHLNWGSSYVVNDFYRRFVNPDASEKELVRLGRISTVVMMVLAGAIALWLQNSLQAFKIMLQIGAGTGLLFVLRWFWWRINAFSEVAAMVVSFLVAVFFEFGYVHVFGGPRLPTSWEFVLGVAITTGAWVIVTFLTRPTDAGRLRQFYRLAQPGGPGWRAVVRQARAAGQAIDEGEGRWTVPLALLCVLAGCLAVYGALFATGYFIYGNTVPAVALSVVAAASTVFLLVTWRRVSAQ